MKGYHAEKAALRRHAGEGTAPRAGLGKTLKKYSGYYALLFIPVLYFILFKYLPMIGNVLAFRRYSPLNPIFGKEWVGLYYMNMFLTSADFWRRFFNTIFLSVVTLAFCFPLPIVFALLLNEFTNVRFKKLVQTISYLPHFISVVIIVGIISQLLSYNTGVVNSLLKSLGGEAVPFLTSPGWFRTIYVSSELWAKLGWNAIIYIAALSGVNTELYEAAVIDGANRWKQTVYITIPGIMPTIIITLVLSMGGLISVGYEKVLLLANPLNKDTADVISTYVYQLGIVDQNYSFS
ncbi:MAG: ABC transporter permease subunit, partial [Clostridiales bacterium]|nr:ABC transporter permease subunit [Clostridiales bacterium]